MYIINVIINKLINVYKLLNLDVFLILKERMKVIKRIRKNVKKFGYDNFVMFICLIWDIVKL